MSEDLPFVQGTAIRDVFDPTAIQDKPLFCHHIFKFIRVEPSKPPLSGHVDLLVAGELELGPANDLRHMLLVLQLGGDGHCDLANVDPGHRALGLSRGTAPTCLEAGMGTACH